MIAIRNIDHVVLRVRDVDRAVRFYTEVLGANLERRFDESGLHQLRIGSALLDLCAVDSKLGRRGGAAPGPEGRNVDHICFRLVEWNEPAIRAHLAQHGFPEVEVLTIYGAEGLGPSIFIDDPEGNRIELKGPPLEA